MAPAQVVDDADMDIRPEDEEEANRLINEEYKTWKKNSPFLYDMILSTALEWPTLTTQWFPDVKDVKDKNQRVHRLLIGTHTTDNKPNYLQIAEVEIPKSVEPDPHDYDEDRGEIGGYGSKASSGESPAMRWNIVQRIDHPGEVNKARYQPQNPDIIATLAVDGRVLIFDRTKHSSQPTGTSNPQIQLVGHSDEGFGLDWSSRDAGKLATGSQDHTVCIWDLQTLTSSSNILKPVSQLRHHASVVNDVQWSPHSNHFLGSVSDDITAAFFDTRSSDNAAPALRAKDGHRDAINALAFHPTKNFMVGTASGDHTIGLWDLRKLTQKFHTLEGHSDSVTVLAWHPTEKPILGSGGYDRRIMFWDLSKIGEEQQPEDAEDGPPELLFMHGGHTNNVADFSWNRNEPWLVASAAEDNLLQVWKVADSIVGPDDADLAMAEIDTAAGNP